MISALRRFFLRSTSFFRAGRAESDLNREIDSHLQLLEDKFIEQGMRPEDARDAARRAFGGVDQVKESQRDTRTFGWLDNSWLDFKLGARMLIKYPGLTLIGGLGMAMAIAIGAVSFAFFYASVHPTLPLHEGERIVGLENWDAAINNQEHRILHDFVTWRDELKSFEDLSAFRPIVRNLIAANGQAEEVMMAEMTAAGFRLARVPPLLGRPLFDDDEREGAHPVAVISYDVWRTRFASDPAAVGRDIRLGSTVHTVVGVMPPDFAFPINHRAWVPLRANPADYERRRGPSIYVFGRLAPGATMKSAQAELATVGLRTAAAFPKTHQQLRPRVVRYTELWFDDGHLADVHIVQTLISMLLIVVSVNVACLVYARTATRQGELAVRTALGASRRRIVGQLFVEALVLSGVAAVAGLALAKLALWQASAAAQQFAALFGGAPFWMDFELSTGTVIYVLALTALAAVVVGVLPGLKATGRHIQAGLRQIGTGASMKLGAMWTVLIVFQIAFAVAVLPGAVFMAWQSFRLAKSPAGFEAEQFLKMQLVLDSETPPSGEADAYAQEYDARYANRLNDLVRRLVAEPGVSGVTIESTHPGGESTIAIEIDSASQSARSLSGRTKFAHVDVNFFETFGVPVLSGRQFVLADQHEAATAVIVNRAFVQQFFGGGNALGRRVGHNVRLSGGGYVSAKEMRWDEIVGVVGNLPANPIAPDDSRARMYLPLVPGKLNPASLALRVRGDTAALAERLRQLAPALDPSMRLQNILPLDHVYRQEQMGWHWGALAFALVTASVVLLSAAGIYALMSFTVTRRRREIGIRVALGADQRRILGNIFSRALGQLAIGIVAGAAIAALLEWGMDGELMGGNGLVLLPIAAALMMAVGALAALGPARRCVRIQPMEALRDE